MWRFLHTLLGLSPKQITDSVPHPCRTSCLLFWHSSIFPLKMTCLRKISFKLRLFSQSLSFLLVWVGVCRPENVSQTQRDKPFWQISRFCGTIFWQLTETEEFTSYTLVYRVTKCLDRIHWEYNYSWNQVCLWKRENHQKVRKIVLKRLFGHDVQLVSETYFSRRFVPDSIFDSLNLHWQK